AVRKDIKTDTGWIVSYYLMYQCFKELGIYSKAKRRAYRRPKGISNKFLNLISGDWRTKGPFEKVCSDTTMIVHQGIKYDWNYHLDVYNNEIVGSDVASDKHCNGVMNHLRSLNDFLRIKEDRGYNETHTILHSNQGIVYGSKKFEKAHKAYSITRSMSRAATPTDNAVIESLNGWIKAELKHNLKMHEFTDVKTAIELYINHFNNNRPAWKLDYLTPVEYRTINGFK
ncbi:MAG: integrase core domain-containing protein, partial [Acholeplasma sp.]|nr:integrase core domain-containing protein [Acholeplasma sp.]